MIPQHLDSFPFVSFRFRAGADLSDGMLWTGWLQRKSRVAQSGRTESPSGLRMGPTNRAKSLLRATPKEIVIPSCFTRAFRISTPIYTMQKSLDDWLHCYIARYQYPLRSHDALTAFMLPTQHGRKHIHANYRGQNIAICRTKT